MYYRNILTCDFLVLFSPLATHRHRRTTCDQPPLVLTLDAENQNNLQISLLHQRMRERERSPSQSVSPSPLVPVRHSPATRVWALAAVCKISPMDPGLPFKRLSGAVGLRHVFDSCLVSSYPWLATKKGGGRDGSNRWHWQRRCPQLDLLQVLESLLLNVKKE